MKHRRFMSMLLTMVMVLSMFAGIPFTASAAASIVTVTDWDGLPSPSAVFSGDTYEHAFD